uniref:Gammaglutamyltranspeptidase putative n=1 Tax=Albugo laibachii Nc14 TaxID=890382 RepID=F0WRX5_9STRA|nr:gammaglutamyltranspeptidase putative [Albugo laibachii Nc14]|eukprot:CCA24092.1 gammaglutamyltranspeptidase putative [Albugo laibachii Nc14]
MGGYIQPQGHVQLMCNLRWFGMDPQKAIDAPTLCMHGLDQLRHVDDTNLQIWLEHGIDESVVQEMRSLGHKVGLISSTKKQCLRSCTDNLKKEYEGLPMKSATVNFISAKDKRHTFGLICVVQRRRGVPFRSCRYRSVPPAFFLPNFSTKSRLEFCISFKLTPNVRRSHMANEHMLPLPPFQRFVAQENCGNISNGKDFVLTFDSAQRRVDWNYPWDLTGSAYTSFSVVFIVQGILPKHGRAGVNHLNVFELYGNQFLKLSAVNQVQDVLKNLLCKMQLITKEDMNCNPATADDLGRYYKKGSIFDELLYKSDRFPSVDIGQVGLITDGSDPY